MPGWDYIQGEFFEHYLLDYPHITERKRYRLATAIEFKPKAQELAAACGGLEGFWNRQLERALREIANEVKQIKGEVMFLGPWRGYQKTLQGCFCYGAGGAKGNHSPACGAVLLPPWLLEEFSRYVRGRESQQVSYRKFALKLPPYGFELVIPPPAQFVRKGGERGPQRAGGFGLLPPRDLLHYGVSQIGAEKKDKQFFLLRQIIEERVVKGLAGI